MRPYLKGEYYDSGFLLSAFAVWLISAFSLLVVSSVILNEVGCSEQTLGYVSSAISFVSALSAGIAAARKRKSGKIYTALLTASVLVTSFLTLGFLIKGAEIEPSAIMSIISFTFSGCMVGAIFPISCKIKKQYRPRI